MLTGSQKDRQADSQADRQTDRQDMWILGQIGPDWNCFLTLRLLLSIEIDPTAKLQILVKNLEKILKIKTQKVVFIVQKTLRAKTTLNFI